MKTFSFTKSTFLSFHFLLVLSLFVIPPIVDAFARSHSVTVGGQSSAFAANPDTTRAHARHTTASNQHSAPPAAPRSKKTALAFDNNILSASTPRRLTRVANKVSKTVLLFNLSPSGSTWDRVTAAKDRVKAAKSKTALSLSRVAEKSKSALNFLGRFRKKKALPIGDPIAIGSPLPQVDVEVVNDQGTSEPVTIHELLGTGKCVLVGMPGAYTPTCNVHLPGYQEAFDKLQKDCGVNTIAVVTTNDRYVNDAWKNDVLGISKNAKGDTETTTTTTADKHDIVMLSDGDAELASTIGLAEDMGFGIGVRSKRFAMVVEDGVVTHLQTDEGMEDCANTSAQKLVEILSPQVASIADGGDDSDQNSKVLTAAGALLVGLYLFSNNMSDMMHVGVDTGGAGDHHMHVAAAMTATTSTMAASGGAGNTFDLLKAYGSTLIYGGF